MLRVPSWVPGSGTINAFFEWAEGVFVDLWAKVDAVWDTVTGYVQRSLDNLQGWVDWLVPRIAELRQGIDDALALAQAAIEERVRETIQNITNIYQNTTENITNVYNAVTESITNVYETVNNIVQNTFTTVQGVTETWVSEVIGTALAPLAPVLAFYNAFGEQVGAFFNDPDNYIMARFEAIAEKQAQRLLRLVERILEVVW